MEQVYCIYTDMELPRDRLSPEHIIPLSLGGSSGFKIMVDATANSKTGHDIDGAIANDFLTNFRRRKADARGHSKKAPFPLAKYSEMISTKKPVQVGFKSSGLEVFSPIDNRYLTAEETGGQQFKSTFLIKPDDFMKFTAKVALGAGYYIHGDLFRKYARHADLRRIMNFDRTVDTPENMGALTTRTWFWPYPPEDHFKDEMALQQALAGYLDCSFVLAIPGASNIGLIVGILGQVVGFMNVPAEMREFPLFDDYDLGHAVILKKSGIRRCSYRTILKEIYKARHGDLPPNIP